MGNGAQRPALHKLINSRKYKGGMKHQLKVLVFVSFSKDVSMTSNKLKVLPQTYLLISISDQVRPSIMPKAVNEKFRVVFTKSQALFEIEKS
jgi:hypothetical protein